jgi:hypothetical protein
MIGEHVSYRIYTHDQLRQIVPPAELYALDPTAIEFEETYAEGVTVDPDAPIEPGDLCLSPPVRQPDVGCDLTRVHPRRYRTGCAADGRAHPPRRQRPQ